MQRLAAPAFIVLVVFAPELLAIFGPGYTVGVFVTVVLAIAKTSDVATGPCGVMLNQGGENLRGTLINVVAVVVAISLDLVLIPHHGIRGAAVAWGIALVLANVARVLAVRGHVVAAFPFERSVWRTVVAMLVAGGAGVLSRFLVPGEWTLLVSLPTVAATYGAVMLLLGLPAEDRLVLANIRGLPAQSAPVASQLGS
jgi:O-antigen/teichoic acid export membrane protein